MLITGQMKLLASSHSLLWVCECAAYACCCFLEGPTAWYFSDWGLSFEAICWVVWAYGDRYKYEIIVNSAVLLNSTFLQRSDSGIPSTQAVMQELIFAMDVGWGCEQAPWSTTSSGGDMKPIIDPGLRNQWLLYYVIIDGARKCHGQSTTYYLLCWIVSLVCVRLLCSALVFPYHVYLYCVQLAFIFLLWFHPGKWMLVLFRGYKGNKFFHTLQWA